MRTRTSTPLRAAAVSQPTNHGEHVSSVSRESKDLQDAGLISARQRGALVSAAGRLECGKR